MSKSDKTDGKKAVDRRGFLKGAAAGAVGGFVAQSQVAQAQQASPAEGSSDVSAGGSGSDRCGSDFMVDVIKSLGIEYCAANPGTSFRGLHESLINYGGNSN